MELDTKVKIIKYVFAVLMLFLLYSMIARLL